MSACETPPTRVISVHGELLEGPQPEDRQVALWGHCLHQGAPGLVEVVAARRQRDGKLRPHGRGSAGHFPAAGDLETLVALTAQHRAQGEEVFCTPLSRRQPRSGKAGRVLPARVAWVDFDDPAALDGLRRFGQRPHMVIYSGSGGAHAYWRLARAVSPEHAEQINRKLAAHLDGDLGVCDQARIMRLCGTHNYKVDRPCRLVYCDLARPAVAPDRLVAGLTDPNPPPPPPTPAEQRRHQQWREIDDAANIAPPAYFGALTGVHVPERGGHIPCPLPDHEEQLASCMVYADPAEGWHCYGCQRGGTIYDLASLIDGGACGRALRGEEFRGVKARVQEQLGIGPPPAPARCRRPRTNAKRSEHAGNENPTATPTREEQRA